MSNLESDHYDYATDPRCTCRVVHGNADTDGICDHCRPKFEAAYEAGCGICGEPGDPRERDEDNVCPKCQNDEGPERTFEGAMCAKYPVGE